MPADNEETMTPSEFLASNLDVIEAGCKGLRDMIAELDRLHEAGVPACVKKSAYVKNGLLTCMGNVMILLRSKEIGSSGEVILGCDTGVYLVSSIGNGPHLLSGTLLAAAPDDPSDVEPHRDN